MKYVPALGPLTGVLFWCFLAVSAFGQSGDWDVQNSGVTCNLYSVAAISSQIAIFCGNGGTIIKTIDGGEN